MSSAPYRLGRLLVVVSAASLTGSLGLLTYLEKSPDAFFEPIGYFLSTIGPDPTDAPAMRATPTFSFSEANVLLVWALLCLASALAGLLATALPRGRSLPSQPRAAAFVFSCLSLLCFVVLAPFLRVVLQLGYG
jgi:hypothetical protein